MSRGFEELLRTREEFEESKAVVCVFGAMSRASSKEQRKAAASPGSWDCCRPSLGAVSVWRMAYDDGGLGRGTEGRGRGQRSERYFCVCVCRPGLPECIRRVYIPLDIPIYQNFAKAKAKRKARWHVSGPSVVRQQWEMTSDENDGGPDFCICILQLYIIHTTHHDAKNATRNSASSPPLLSLIFVCAT